MIECGMKQEDLKPAFLMLATCATEVARAQENGDTKSSEDHTCKARLWFHKAFGNTSSPRVLEPEAGNLLALEPVRFSPKGTSTNPAETSSTIDTAPPLPSRLDALHAELVQLRTDKLQLANQLSVARAAKRCREEELQTERIVVRRLERQRDFNADTKRKAEWARSRVDRDSTARPTARDSCFTGIAGKGSGYGRGTLSR